MLLDPALSNDIPMAELDLPPAELDVMSCLWRNLVTAGEIREALNRRRPMAHASVCTLLKRLEDKGCVERQKGPTGKAFVYRALIQPTKTSKTVLSRLLDRLFGGNGVALVASLLETRPPSDDELS